MNRDASQVARDLIARARSCHAPDEPVDWRAYELLKRKLCTVYEPGTYEYDDALRQILSGLEIGE